MTSNITKPKITNHSSDNDVVLSVQGVSKKFCRSLKRSLFYGVQDIASELVGVRKDNNQLRKEEFWALQDVSFELPKGKALGLIGRNGSGKTTLLKIISGLIKPDTGSVKITGRVAPLIALGAGFNPILTGRENIYVNMSILGLSKEEIDKCFDEVVDFAEIGDAINAPVQTYSSGMLARLGFACAVHVEPEILLVDEVLSVGDFSFQKKCISKVSKILNQGTTTIFVSHNPYIMERICDRVIWLHYGNMNCLGNPQDVIPKYFESSSIETNQLTPLKNQISPDLRPGTGELRITKVELINSVGEVTQELLSTEQVTFRLHYETTELVEKPNFGIRIFDPQNTIILSLASTAFKDKLRLEGQGYLDCKISRLSLMPNKYTIQIKVAKEILTDLYENATRFIVKKEKNIIINSANMGLVYLDSEWIF